MLYIERCYTNVITLKLCNMFESIIIKRLRSLMKYSISNNQHGVLPKKSTFSNLFVYADFITENINNKPDDRTKLYASRVAAGCTRKGF